MVEADVSIKEKQDTVPIKPWKVAVVMILMAILAPANFGISWTNEWSMVAMLWAIVFWFLEIRMVIFHPLLLISNTPLYFPRIVFAYQMFRYYKKRTTRRNILLVGLASELVLPVSFLVNVIITYLMVPQSWGFTITFPCPIPILLIVGYLFIKLRPVKEIVSPWKVSNNSRQHLETKDD